MNERTLVTFLLDRSGSMDIIKDDTIGAFNAYLKGLQDEGELIDFTLLQFDSYGTDKLCTAVPVHEATKLNDDNFQPRATTPLIDAVYETIKDVEQTLMKACPTCDPIHKKIVVCILTDGHENASRKHSWNALHDLVKQKTEAGWQFNFMGAGIDAYDQGARMGISVENTMSYNSKNLANTKAAFSGRARATNMYASGASMDMAFSPAEKFAAGDKYNKDNKA